MKRKKRERSEKKERKKAKGSASNQWTIKKLLLDCGGRGSIEAIL